MGDETAVRYAVQDAVATLTMDQPHNRNALTPVLMSGLAQGLEAALADEAVGVIVLTNTGPAFCAGADLSGERISAARAAEVGLITRAVPAADLDAEVAAVVARLLAGGPSALAAAKRLVYTIPGMDREAAFTRTTEVSEALFASAEAAEGMAAFREKRLPSWAPPPSES